MDGPGPSTQEKAAARALRAARRASGDALRNAQQSQSAQSSQLEPRAAEGPTKEDESSDESSDDDDNEDENDGQEKPPVFHHEIWRRLLRRARRSGLRYVNGEPESGNHPLDVTAVEESQMAWYIGDRTGNQTSARAFWPNNLTLYDAPNPRNNPTYEIGVMKYKGRVVLDYKENPIRNFRIPATISSKVEGLRIEAWMRSDHRLNLGDIEARVWTKVRSDGERVPAFNKRALSKRANNARTKAGLVSWVPKKGRDKQREFMNNLRTDAQRANNLATDKDLTSQEKAQLSLFGLDEERKSGAPTRQARIDKMKRTAGAGGTVAAPSLEATTTGPSDQAAAASDDDDDDDSSSDDSDREEGVQDAHMRDQDSEDDTDDEGSISSSLTDPLDSRNDRPTNPQEEAILRAALQDTVNEFSFLSGHVPVLASPGDNYFSQWGMLQEQFTVLWVARGNTEEAPRLIAKDRWTGGISQLEPTEEMEVADDEESRQA